LQGKNKHVASVSEKEHLLLHVEVFY